MSTTPIRKLNYKGLQKNRERKQSAKMGNYAIKVNQQLQYVERMKKKKEKKSTKIGYYPINVNYQLQKERSMDRSLAMETFFQLFLKYKKLQLKTHKLNQLT